MGTEKRTRKERWCPWQQWKAWAQIQGMMETVGPKGPMRRSMKGRDRSGRNRRGKVGGHPGPDNVEMVVMPYLVEYAIKTMTSTAKAFTKTHNLAVLWKEMPEGIKEAAEKAWQEKRNIATILEGHQRDFEVLRYQAEECGREKHPSDSDIIMHTSREMGNIVEVLHGIWIEQGYEKRTKQGVQDRGWQVGAGNAAETNGPHGGICVSECKWSKYSDAKRDYGRCMRDKP